MKQKLPEYASLEKWYLLGYVLKDRTSCPKIIYGGSIGYYSFDQMKKYG